jgi:hypothetical protein
MLAEAESVPAELMLRSVCFLHTERKSEGEPPDQVVFLKDSTIFIHDRERGASTQIMSPTPGPKVQIGLTQSLLIHAPVYCPRHQRFGRKPYFLLQGVHSVVICDLSGENCIYLYKQQIEAATEFFTIVSNILH